MNKNPVTTIVLTCIFLLGVVVTFGAQDIRNGGKTQTADTTTVPVPEVIRLVAVGDISCSQGQRESGKYDCADPNVADLVRAIGDIDHLLLLGDIQYHSHTVKNFRENFGLIWNDLLHNALPVPGNHEYVERGAKGYYATWTKFPKPGYYSVELNDDWRIIALNTNDNCTDVPCREGSEQYAWLKAELEANPGKCTIAMMHHPRFSSGSHGSSKSVSDVWKLLEKYSVPLVLAGHDHHYERFNTKPAQYVVGTGGKSLRSTRRTPETGSVTRMSDHHGVLLVTIEDRTVHTEFMSIDGSVHDYTTTECH